MALTCALAFLVSLISCEVLRVLAIRKALFDNPNERSLHTVPTPRLGGLGICAGTLGLLAGVVLRGSFEIRVLIGAAAVVACLGLVDDIRPLPASVRFLIQIAASAIFIWLVGVPKILLLPGVVISLPVAVSGALLTIWMTGVLNIYNFMDGMDGLAGAQAVGAGVGAAVLAGPCAPELVYPAVTLASASGGFLLHNFPPARMFMGDAGSTFVGFLLAGFAVIGMHHEVPFMAIILPVTPFLLDGTFTIFRRASRRERIWQAHRTHLYQRAVQTDLSHREVLLVYAAWMAIALAGAIWNPLVGWAATVAVLVLIWRWVVRRELQKPSAA